jgi:hypothetical protein
MVARCHAMQGGVRPPRSLSRPATPASMLRGSGSHSCQNIIQKQQLDGMLPLPDALALTWKAIRCERSRRRRFSPLASAFPLQVRRGLQARETTAEIPSSTATRCTIRAPRTRSPTRRNPTGRDGLRPGQAHRRRPGRDRLGEGGRRQDPPAGPEEGRVHLLCRPAAVPDPDQHPVAPVRAEPGAQPLTPHRPAGRAPPSGRRARPARASASPGRVPRGP